MENPSISIIIVLYKSEEVIFNCIHSIINTKGFESTEIILVDNYENSDFEEVLKSKKIATAIPINYIKNPINGGFGQGNNVGVSHAKGNIIFFLNPDTILQNNFSFTEIIKLFSSSTKPLVVGFKLIDQMGKENNSYSIFPEYSLLAFFYKITRKILFTLPNTISILNKSIWPWGAAFVLKKKTFEQAGKFDEKMFLCNEEPDLMKRIPDRKIILSTMEIIHLEGHSTTSSENRYSSYIDSAVYYITKHKLNKSFFIRSIIFRERIKKIISNSEQAKKRIEILRAHL